MAEPKTTTGDYNSVYRAKVVENDDPEKMGRVRVQCPRVLGEYKSNWAKVCVPYALDDGGIIQIPRVGEVVWVMFEDGSPSKPIVVGQWWIPNETPLENDEYEDDEKRDRIRRYKTESGHTVTFFDKEGEEYVELETSKGHIIKFVDEDGEQKIKIEDINGNRIEMDTEKDDLNITILNDTNVTVEGATSIVCDDIKIGDETVGTLSGVATEEFVRDLFAIHQHIGNLGSPTSPPVEPVIDLVHITQETEIS